MPKQHHTYQYQSSLVQKQRAERMSDRDRRSLLAGLRLRYEQAQLVHAIAAGTISGSRAMDYWRRQDPQPEVAKHRVAPGHRIRTYGYLAGVAITLAGVGVRLSNEPSSLPELGQALNNAGIGVFSSAGGVMAVEDIRTRVHRRQWGRAKSAAAQTLVTEGRTVPGEAETLGWWEARENLEAVLRCVGQELGLQVADKPNDDELFLLARQADIYLAEILQPAPAPTPARQLAIDPLSR